LADVGSRRRKRATSTLRKCLSDRRQQETRE
jgi:hypothetical protein